VPAETLYATDNITVEKIKEYFATITKSFTVKSTVRDRDLAKEESCQARFLPFQWILVGSGHN